MVFVDLWILDFGFWIFDFCGFCGFVDLGQTKKVARIISQFL
jgi:hypothetical protein